MLIKLEGKKIHLKRHFKNSKIQKKKSSKEITRTLPRRETLRMASPEPTEQSAMSLRVAEEALTAAEETELEDEVEIQTPLLHFLLAAE